MNIREQMNATFFFAKEMNATSLLLDLNLSLLYSTKEDDYRSTTNIINN